jgi:hypothetical protein
MAGALARFMPHIGLKSQRFDMLAHDDTLLPFLLAAGKTSLTCGLEGISERLRNYLHKSLSTVDLDKSLMRILAAPLREIKIFLILTGLENDTDFAEFLSQLVFIKDHLSSSSRNMRLIFSATPLVRFPHTPLAAENAPMPSALKPIISKTKSLVETHGFEFRMSSDADDYCMSQIMIRASDKRIYEALAATMAETGFIMYRSVPQLFVNAFIRNLLSSGITVEACLLAGSGKPETLPWSYFDTGVTGSFITSQHESAKEYQDKGFCLGSADKPGECKACGACDACDAESRSAITAMRTAARYPLATFKEITKRWYSNITGVSFYVDICDSKRGIPRSVIGTAIGRALMTTSPECVSFFGGMSHSLLANGTGTCWITGHDIITLKWRKEGLQHLELLIQKPESVTLINKELAGFCTILSFNQQEPQEYELSVISPFEFSPNAYFVKHGLTYLLRKQNNGFYSFEFSKQALKKNMIRSFSYSIKQDGEFCGKMRVTRKFIVEDFLNEVFAIANQAEVVKIRVTAGFTITTTGNR